MAEAITLTARRRSDTGKGAARQSRMRGQIPAVIYGSGRESVALTLALKEFEHALSGHSAGSTVIDLSIDGEPVKTLIREIQRHPYKPRILHVDFMEIHAGQSLKVNVPVRLVGSPEGVKNAGGVLDQVLRDVEVEVLPRNIPDHIDLDVSPLEINQSFHVSDLEVPNAKVLTDPANTICTVVPPRVELEVHAEVPEEVEEAEPELIRKQKEEAEETESSEE